MCIGEGGFLNTYVGALFHLYNFSECQYVLIQKFRRFESVEEQFCLTHISPALYFYAL